ncbi:MAG: hypothetical protein MJ237_05145 [bacterium]|nr:hypothetical protein [bacterium]
MNINNGSLIPNSEREALKELIFSRARERAENLAKNAETSYTNDIRQDIMDIARQSFVAPQNPFSLKEEKSQNNVSETLEVTETSESQNNEIGFPIKNTHKHIPASAEVIERSFVQSELIKNMEDARRNLQSSKGFVGALNFLNSQATIALVNKNNGNFEATA